MNHLGSLLSLIFSATLVVCMIAGIYRSRGTAASDRIAASLTLYKVALAAAILGVAVDLLDPDWFMLLDVATLAAVAGAVHFCSGRLRNVRAAEALRARQTAADLNLPWVGDD